MTQRIDSRHVFGGEVQYFRTQPRYWAPILDQLVDSGLTTVTTYVQWRTHLVGDPNAQHPAGELDFEGRTRPELNLLRFLDLVQERGLSCNFRCGPFCCNEEIHGGYPSWIIFDPAISVWDSQNRTTQGYWIGKPEGSQPSYLHPHYLDWCRKWIDAIGPIIRPRLKTNGGCVSMVNLDNEVSYIVQDGFLTSDYNPVNVKPGGFYHQFLHEKYGSVTDLPYASRYAAIEDVPAPRHVPDVVGDDFAYYADWCEFKTWVMARYIAEIRQMHEANDVEDVTFMTNFNPHRPEGVPTRMPAFEAACGSNGIAGYDFYRGTFMSYSGYHSMARVLKLMNATLHYTWAAEFMAGTFHKLLRSRVSDDHMRFMGLCALAQGCKAISWFMFHDRDCWGDAPVSSHGHARPSLQVLREIRQLACETIPSWDALSPKADLVIVYDLTAHQHTYLGDPSPCADNDLHVGAPHIDGTAAGQASTEYEGLFRLVEHTGRQAAVIDPVHKSAVLHPQKTPMALLPGCPVLHSSTREALSAYVRDGGQLVVSGPWPQRDETGKAAQLLEGPPDAAGEHSFGRGRYWWFSDYLAQTEAEHDALESIEQLQQVFEAALPVPHVRIEPTETVTYVDWKHNLGYPAGTRGHMSFTQPRNLLSAVIHADPDTTEQILFVLNHYPEAATCRVTLADRNASSLRDLFTGQSVPLRDGVAELDLDRKAASVFRIVRP